MDIESTKMDKKRTIEERELERLIQENNNRLTSSKQRGSVNLFYGPMFSGKSTRLYQILNEESQYEKNKILLLRFSEDLSRYKDIRSHGGYTLENVKNITVVAITDLTDKFIEGLGLIYNIIGVDEGQFINGIDKLAIYCLDNDIDLFISALNGKFDRTSWPNIDKLTPHLTKPKLCKAVCKHCGRDAIYSVRLAKSKDDKLIGGADKYESTCAKHYTNINEEN